MSNHITHTRRSQRARSSPVISRGDCGDITEVSSSVGPSQNAGSGWTESELFSPFQTERTPEIFVMLDSLLDNSNRHLAREFGIQSWRISGALRGTFLHMFCQYNGNCHSGSCESARHHYFVLNEMRSGEWRRDFGLAGCASPGTEHEIQQLIWPQFRRIMDFAVVPFSHFSIRVLAHPLPSPKSPSQIEAVSFLALISIPGRKSDSKLGLRGQLSGKSVRNYQLGQKANRPERGWESR